MDTEELEVGVQIDDNVDSKCFLLENTLVVYT